MPWLALDIAVKLALIGLLAYAVVRRDLPQFRGKAMAGRALTYPLATLVVPVAWWALGAPGEYPVTLDILLVMPFLIDTAGNALDIYDRISWWDDLNHFGNWGLLVAACGQLLVRMPLDRPVVAGLAIGFGAVTAILWEFAEYITFIRHSPELATAYTDTLGDLAFGLSGSVVAALLTVSILWPT